MRAVPYSCTGGLYDPRFDHDACGVGFVCRLDGVPRASVVRQGLAVLARLAHRGACGCDPETGDGAGLLIQLPHAFFAAEAGVPLPAPGAYGVATLFLSPDPEAQHRARCLFEQVVQAHGQALLGWRLVPVHPGRIGAAARARMPSIWQAFVGRGAGLDGAAFERRLYVIRRSAERAAREARLAEDACFGITGCSARTLVYKGMLTPAQVPAFYPDLRHPAMASALALVHARFSTNTMPEWTLAHPFRFLAHNGEINTLHGNRNALRARQALFASPLFEDLAAVLPVAEEGASDSATLDAAVELLVHAGRSLPHAMMMLVPEAWEHDARLPDHRRAFYEYHAALMEPWDGPATIPFTDGRYVGAVLDRNGLRPSRYVVTTDGLVVLASEAGVLDVPPARIAHRGRLQPGRMLLIDIAEHRIVPDEEIKDALASRRPYRAWLDAHRLSLADLPGGEVAEAPLDDAALRCRQRLFGYTREDERLLLPPMAREGREALGSMGDDTPLAVLSERPRLLYDYFRQGFAQVTNPPLDALREKLVTSLGMPLGAGQNLLAETPLHARVLWLDQPVLTPADLARLRACDRPGFRTATLPILFPAERADGDALEAALDDLCARAAEAVRAGVEILMLSDEGADAEQMPIPALLATAAVHHHLIREGLRARCGLVVESGEPREVHHFALLIGYGAQAVCPTLALQTAPRVAGAGVAPEEAVARYVGAVCKGLLMVMSKRGISTLRSYAGAQIFESVGLGEAVVERHFTGTPSRIGGVGLGVLAEEARRRHAHAFPPVARPSGGDLDVGGRYQWRRGGERHGFDPLAVAHLQQAVRQDEFDTYAVFAARVNDVARPTTLRGLLDFDVEGAVPVPLDAVEPWTDIVRRFKTGAMSYGSLGQEAHEALAEAMNRLGGRSNTGEGGEDPARYGAAHPARSRIKQVASGRFGVTISYLASADEIQIKMAQGAKPGEGGQLPAEKVLPWIARTRHATPYVGLISPPPHHDIYSIEDLAQLIHDLKNANPRARISVKLVATAGVGTIAAGVAKGKADVILISGSDGGTGASPQTSIAHAGLPWELGLGETHQTLVRHGLRSRVRLECDGRLQTGRDVAIAALLGADEFGFATAPLVAMGCIMMRKCHLNTCPVGIATQNPALRRHFSGTPEHVINYFHFVAEELRRLMARLGFRTLGDMVGRTDRLRPRPNVDHWKARHLDLGRLLHRPETPALLAGFRTDGQDHGLDGALDHWLLAEARDALENATPVTIDVPLRNTNRTVGTMLSAEVVRRHGPAGLPDGTVALRCIGVAGQSFLAFGAPGIEARVEGEVNDYLGKGLSGARLVVVPPAGATFDAHHQIIAGNVALYGATSGEAYLRGQAGERFAVRNSGAVAVVEGVGDHGCEYMTGGRVVVLGPTGRNFAAGMSGGIAYVLDGTWDFRHGRCNPARVELLPVEAPEDREELRALVAAHYRHTGSVVAGWVLHHWEQALREFVKVLPVEYRNALLRLEREAGAVSEPLAA
ncbi:MAG: glutamate synthase large subunit [Rhodothermales bacterium]|nr:glutamate synthase large subunit [Rhodothermales bacterium]